MKITKQIIREAYDNGPSWEYEYDLLDSSMIEENEHYVIFDGVDFYCVLIGSELAEAIKNEDFSEGSCWASIIIK